MNVLRRLMKVVAARLSPSSSGVHALDTLVQLELSREMQSLQSKIRETMPDNPAARGFKVYSQADEDGIIEEICHRLGLQNGTFIEIGCGDGRENNTHYLLLKGWRGVWVDGDSANIESIRAALPTSERLRVVEKIVTRENIASAVDEANSAADYFLDLFSVDVDGNDLAIALSAIVAWSPKIIVGEYNAKFPYSVVAAVAYDPDHRWHSDDYHGASLAAWVEALRTQYRLVCCNLAGTNAFFVRSDLASPFLAYEPASLYQPARFFLTALRSGHPATLSFLRNELSAQQCYGDPPTINRR